MPVSVAVERPQPVELRIRFGAYATIAVRDGAGRLHEAPTLLAAVRPVPGWERACLAAVDAALPPCGATIAVQGTAAGLGAFDELAVLDVLVADDRTLPSSWSPAGSPSPIPTCSTGTCTRRR